MNPPGEPFTTTLLAPLITTAIDEFLKKQLLK